MGTGRGAQVGLGDDGDSQGAWNSLWSRGCLMEYRSGCAPPPWSLRGIAPGVVVIDLVAILAPGTTAALGTGVGEVERRIAPQLGNEMQAALSHTISRALWLPKCPSSTRDVTESTAIIRWSNIVSMVWSRTSSGVRITGTLPWFVLPFGRPGRRVVPDPAGFLAAALALLAAFSASVRTTCSMHKGKERRCGASFKDRVRPARVPAAVETRKKPIQPMGCLPALVATT